MKRLRLTYIQRQELFAEAPKVWDAFADSNPEWCWGTNSHSMGDCKRILTYMEDVSQNWDLANNIELNKEYNVVIKRLKKLNKSVYINFENEVK